MADPIYWPSFFFLLFAGIACAFAVAVVVSPNIVRMAFYLVLSLAATAGLFFLAGADFVGSMQILIYVGGTLVLLVFGVMLTSQDRFISMQDQPRRNARSRRWSALACLPCWSEPLGACRLGRHRRAIKSPQFRSSRPPRPIGMGLLGRTGR